MQADAVRGLGTQVHAIVVIPAHGARDTWATQVCVVVVRVPVMPVHATVVIPVDGAWDKVAAWDKVVAWDKVAACNKAMA